MTTTIETKQVTRKGRKVTAWRIAGDDRFACGHVARVETNWRTEGSAAQEHIQRTSGDCPDCRWVKLGGPIQGR